MGKKKEANRDRFNEAEAVVSHEDPLIQQVINRIQTEDNQPLPDPGSIKFMGLDEQIKQYEEQSRVVALRNLEIRNKELEMALHLAKAKICEFELLKLKEGE